MNKLISSLAQSIITRISTFIKKIQRMFSKQLWEREILNRMRTLLMSVMGIRPRNKKDYIPVLSWLVSRRLVIMLVTVIGVLSCYYLVFVNPPSILGGDGIRTYNYNSIPLRFTDGTVRIRAKSGYIAYEGEVEKGFVNGSGSLYDEYGSLVYTGEFEKNKYNGQGTAYYEGGQPKYVGTFTDNLYDGTGILYRENGSQEYEGSFSRGMKEGEGTLYNSGNSAVFTGNFSQDELLYSDLVGKSTEELTEIYTGTRSIYTDAAGDFAVLLEDINAVYAGTQDGAALDDSMAVDGIYVLKNTIRLGNTLCRDISDVITELGTPSYEGNSQLKFSEAAAVNSLARSEDTKLEPVQWQTQQEYSDVVNVTQYDEEASAYLYSFSSDGLIYTFFCGDQSGAFDMYLIEKE